MKKIIVVLSLFLMLISQSCRTIRQLEIDVDKSEVSSGVVIVEPLNLDIKPLKKVEITEINDNLLSIQFADYILSTWPNPKFLTKKGWEYNNSIILHGLEEVYLKTGKKEYLDYIEKWADNYITASGLVAFDKGANNLDHLHPGILALFLYEHTGKDKYKQAADVVRREFDNQPRNSVGGFWHKEHYPNEMWADGIYMAEPFLAKYGSLFNDGDYAYSEVSKQILLVAEHSQDPETGLVYHGWDEDKNAAWADRETGLSSFFWSRGMGWYAMALVDVLDYLPKDYPTRDSILHILREVARGLELTQDRESGLWFQVMEEGGKPKNFLETSGSAMFVYSLKKALDNKYIEEKYRSVVEKGWEGVKGKVKFNTNGKPVITDAVQGMGVQSSYSSYVDKEKLENSTHGLCAILLASSVMEY